MLKTIFEKCHLKSGKDRIYSVKPLLPKSCKGHIFLAPLGLTGKTWGRVRPRAVMAVFVACFILTFTSGCHFHMGPPEQAAEAYDIKKEETTPPSDEEILKEMEEAYLVNPWGETQSLSVATEWAGFSFDPPAENILLQSGQEIELTTYRYMTGAVEAVYKSEDYDLRVRKSNDDGNSETDSLLTTVTDNATLSEDQDPDALEWEESIKGIPVRCIGDGELIHEAYFDVDNGHYSITFDCAEEGLGLTAEDLAEILAGML